MDFSKRWKICDSQLQNGMNGLRFPLLFSQDYSFCDCMNFYENRRPEGITRSYAFSEVSGTFEITGQYWSEQIETVMHWFTKISVNVNLTIRHLLWWINIHKLRIWSKEYNNLDTMSILTCSASANHVHNCRQVENFFWSLNRYCISLLA